MKKKVFGILAALLLLIGLSACSSSTESTTTTNQTSGSTELIKDNISLAYFDGKTKYYYHGEQNNQYIVVDSTSMKYYKGENLEKTSEIVVYGEHFFFDRNKVYYIDSDIVYAIGDKVYYYLSKVLH